VPAVRRILIVGPEAPLRDALLANGHDLAACEFVPAGDSPMGSVLKVLSHVKGNDQVLFTTADLPLVTSTSVQTFLRACRCRAGAASLYPTNIYVSAVLGRSFTGRFARSRKGHMIFREGAVYHGNLVLADPRAFETLGVVKVMERLYQGPQESPPFGARGRVARRTQLWIRCVPAACGEHGADGPDRIQTAGRGNHSGAGRLSGDRH
jgi:hypothetical protein